ncbi:MAG: flagellar hook-associated protein FlgK [Deltaproteobacteria bacterium]|nr:flagellar hook-associated protein FlgK [Deltaproteobacteria bacterium]
MSTLFSILNTAQSGIAANATGISVTGENITGANTPGFSKRTALLENLPLGGAQAGGVTVAGVARAHGLFAERALLVEHGHWGAADARAAALSRAEDVLAPGDGLGLDDRFADFFESWDDLAQKPDDLALRRNVALKGESLASAFNVTANELEAIRAGLLSDAEAVVGEVNARLSRIRQLNDKVASSQSATSGKAELQDERDRLIREVAERLSVTVLSKDDGTVALLSSGVALMDGGVVRTLSVSTQPYDPLTPTDPRTVLKFEATLPGGTPRDITNGVTGGRLAGLREARDVDLIARAEELDQLAFDFAGAANAAHASGLDLNLNVPPDLFVGGLGAVAAPPGSAEDITFNPTILADLRTIGAASALNPPPGGNENALALSALQSGSLAGLGSPAERVGQLLARSGNDLVAAETEQRLRESTRSHAEQLREETAGVSLDEEMIQLTKFQRAFQASMRVLQTADELLQELVQRL